MKNVYKLRQFNTLKMDWEEIKFSMPDDYGETCTDSTHYRPNTSIWDSGSGASNVQGCFDFADGKDDGNRTLQMLRNQGLDQVEKDEIIKDGLKAGQKAKENIKADVLAELEKMQAEKLDKVTSNDTTTSKNMAE